MTGVTSHGSSVIHRPAICSVPRPACAPNGANPWITYRTVNRPVTCKKCLKNG